MENNDITKEELKLPFEKKKHEDWVSWVYEHRAGLLVTIIIYLLLGISLVTKIDLKKEQSVQAILIDFSASEEEQENIHEEKQEITERITDMEDFRNVRNLTSNENAQLDAGLRDARETRASDIYNEAQALQDKLNSSREAYEQGLKDADNILAANENVISGDSDISERSKVEGKVTVSYDLPGRNDIVLPVPAYRCQGGGTVVINISVNRNGAVISSSVNRNSSSDPCLVKMASKAAASSRFNVSSDSPERQNGTITYIFIPQ